MIFLDDEGCPSEPIEVDLGWCNVGYMEPKHVCIHLIIDRERLEPYIRQAAGNKKKESNLLRKAFKIKVVDDCE